MVARTRASLGTHTLRALNVPAPLTVQVDAAEQPVSVRSAGWLHPRIVARVQDCWRIDDEWWREQPISRLYYVLLLDNDTLVMVYHDLLTECWYEQRS
jgi:hypothetical protein